MGKVVLAQLAEDVLHVRLAVSSEMLSPAATRRLESATETFERRQGAVAQVLGEQRGLL